MAKGTTLLAILWLLSWARRKEHSLISTPRMRVRRLQSIAALTCLCGIAFRSAAPHSPTLVMGPGNAVCSGLSAKLLQQSPENISSTARADLFSLHPDLAPAGGVRSSRFRACALDCHSNGHLDGEHAHIYAFRKHGGVGAGCAVFSHCSLHA